MTGPGASSNTFWWRRCRRTVAFAQMHGAALAVAKDLDLDVARALEVFLHVDFVIAEGVLRLGPGGAEGHFQLGLGFRHLHAAPAAAGGGLDDDRIADLGGHDLRRLEIGHAAVRPRNHRNPQRFRGFLGGDLVAHDADMLRRGADEGDAVVFQRLGEGGVFRQEAIARMHGLRAGDLAGRDDGGLGQVAFRTGGRADADRLVGHPHMHRIGIRRRMHRDRLDPHLARRADHPQRDLSAVGDQDFLEHAPPALIR
jgi:hypothetical protein